MAGRASGIIRTGMRQASVSRLGRVLGGAGVVLDELIAQRCCHSLGARGVRGPNHLPVCDGVVAAVASTELSSFEDRDRAEDLRAGTRDFVAHAAAVAETRRDDVRRVDTVIVLDQFDHVVGEGQVASAGIRPAGAETIGRDEDRAVLRGLLKPVIGPVVPRGSAVVDLGGITAIPVKTEDQPIRFVLVVVVGKPQRKAPALAAALNRKIAAGTEAHTVPRPCSGRRALVRDRRKRQRRSLTATGTPRAGTTRRGSARAASASGPATAGASICGAAASRAATRGRCAAEAGRATHARCPTRSSRAAASGVAAGAGCATHARCPTRSGRAAASGAAARTHCAAGTGAPGYAAAPARSRVPAYAAAPARTTAARTASIARTTSDRCQGEVHRKLRQRCVTPRAGKNSIMVRHVCTPP